MLPESFTTSRVTSTPRGRRRVCYTGAVPLDESDVRAAAALARLALRDEEVETFQRDLDAFLAHVRDLEDLDLTDVPPMLAPHAEGPRLRADEPRESLPREAALAAAPAHDGESFVMPAAIRSGTDRDGGGAER